MLADKLVGLKRILVVDDDDDDRHIIKRFLYDEPYAVTEAVSVFDALELLKTSTFDLILVDVVMPGIDGIEMMEILKVRNIGAKVVVMSGSLMNSVLYAAIGLGACASYQKTSDGRKLVSLLSKLL